MEERYIFKESDFEGSGQYLVLDRAKPNEFKDAGYLSTIMVKVGYIIGGNYCLISMADGWVMHEWPKTINGKTEFIPIKDKKTLVELLNSDDIKDTHRFATQEEVSRVVNYQSHRWRNPKL